MSRVYTVTVIIKDDARCFGCGSEVEIQKENLQIYLGECKRCSRELWLKAEGSEDGIITWQGVQ